jgi:hypothetical protein
MGGARKLTTSYRKVERSKPKRAVREPDVTFGMYERNGVRSPLIAYIDSNRESGLSVHELVEQFQEYDCEHRFYPSGIFPSPTEPMHWLTCEICALTEKRKGRGPKSG